MLYTKGYQPKSHAGVVSLSGEEVVKKGKASQADRKFLARSQTRREQADYAYKSLQEDMDELFDRTEKFLAKMKRLV